MTLLTAIYMLCALTGTFSLAVLSIRAVPHLPTVDAHARQTILNRMLLSAGLASFGSMGLLAVGVFSFDAPYSLLSAAFFGLLFTRSAFAALKALLHRQLLDKGDEE